MTMTPVVKYNNQVSDIFSCLLEERIVFIAEPITDALALSVVAQLLFLESQDPEKDISVYINSPGGSVSAGLAIYDTMQFIKCDVSTICVGMAASMGAFLLAAGTPGKRYALPNSTMMIHQPLGGTEGQASDILIHASHIANTRSRLNQILAKNTNKSIKQIKKDTDRDHYMTAVEACSYGLIDKVIERK